MKIALGGDHRGSEVLLELTATLGVAGHELITLGDFDSGRSLDYPDSAWPVAQAVASGKVDFGILVCGSGIGSCITANKMRGVRAAQVHDEIGAETARRHHDANVLCMAADMMGRRLIDRAVETFLATEFEGGRHERRLNKVAAIEAGVFVPAAAG
ncbi:MAG: RpiB/LacA/LacB family sugar-phosphate isomerase [Planctomycetota bacterium]